MSSSAIKQMVQFIEQEAMEKCEEIAMKANEEFEQEKNRIKMEEKVPCPHASHRGASQGGGRVGFFLGGG